MPKSHKQNCKNYYIKDIDGKGKGLVSRRNIKAGELICEDKAAFVLDSGDINRETVSQKYSALGGERQRQFSDLTGRERADSHCDIFLNNAINTDSQQFGIFLTIARVNHSCCPNAVWGSTEASSEVMELRAVKEIPVDTEITADYIGDRSYLAEPQQRLEILQDNWGFTCNCEACVTDSDADIRSFMIKLKKRMKEKLCAGEFGQVFKLHCHKMKSVDKMKTRNHNELLNSHQVNVMLAVLSCQEKEVVARSLQEWNTFYGLQESRKHYREVSGSFQNGEPLNRLEFFDENSRVRSEWIKWIYNKL